MYNEKDIRNPYEVREDFLIGLVFCWEKARADPKNISLLNGLHKDMIHVLKEFCMPVDLRLSWWIENAYTDRSEYKLCLSDQGNWIWRVSGTDYIIPPCPACFYPCESRYDNSIWCPNHQTIWIRNVNLHRGLPLEEADKVRHKFIFPKH